MRISLLSLALVLAVVGCRNAPKSDGQPAPAPLPVAAAVAPVAAAQVEASSANAVAAPLAAGAALPGPAVRTASRGKAAPKAGAPVAAAQAPEVAAPKDAPRPTSNADDAFAGASRPVGRQVKPMTNEDPYASN